MKLNGVRKGSFNYFTMASTDQNTPLLINTRRQVTVQLSYSYLFVQINRVREGPSNPSPIESFFRSLLNTILVTLFLTIFLFLPFAMITIGAIHSVLDCPAQPLIPDYLMVMGTLLLVKLVMYHKAWLQRRQLEEGGDQAGSTPSQFVSGLGNLISLLCFACLIAGSVLVYLIYRPNTTDSSSDDYCHPTLYYFAFWVSTAYCIFIALFCFCCCCVYCLGSCAFDEVEQHPRRSL
ncbi:transmembrane protein 272-like isoform X2 [Lytechinus variegatus]|uniref:transmembrane protein 272-like isoform X2 n=1 Tax=Lytechinus variegatus TaxID=7654 RepID=UPI001BB11FC1|nr:transmembrane protein 272-like isoform X2 [Lytechinus variegatus]